jgi:hypothetical protein
MTRWTREDVFRERAVELVGDDDLATEIEMNRVKIDRFIRFRGEKAEQRLGEVTFLMHMLAVADTHEEGDVEYDLGTSPPERVTKEMMER